MNVVLEAAQAVQNFCDQRGWKFCLIGGLACQIWSEPRVTDDVGVTLLTGFGEEGPYLDALLAWLEPRRADARDFAESRRVLLARTPSGVGVDIALAGMAFEHLAVERSVLHEFLPGLRLRVCTAEDFIVFKVFAARGIDWHDVEMTIVRQGDAALDWAYIREQLIPLLELKEQPGLLDELEALRAKLRPRP